MKQQQSNQSITMQPEIEVVTFESSSVEMEINMKCINVLAFEVVLLKINFSIEAFSPS